MRLAPRVRRRTGSGRLNLAVLRVSVDRCEGFLERALRDLFPEVGKDHSHDRCCDADGNEDVVGDSQALEEREDAEAADDGRLEVLAGDRPDGHFLHVAETFLAHAQGNLQRQLSGERDHETSQHERPADVRRRPVGADGLRLGRPAPEGVPAHGHDGHETPRVAFLEAEDTTEPSGDAEDGFVADPFARHLVDEKENEHGTDDAEDRMKPRPGLGHTPEPVVAKGREPDVGRHDRQRPVLERQVVVAELGDRRQHHVDGDADTHEVAGNGNVDPQQEAAHESSQEKNPGHAGLLSCRGAAG